MSPFNLGRLFEQFCKGVRVRRNRRRSSLIPVKQMTVGCLALSGFEI